MLPLPCRVQPYGTGGWSAATASWTRTLRTWSSISSVKGASTPERSVIVSSLIRRRRSPARSRGRSMKAHSDLSRKVREPRCSTPGGPLSLRGCGRPRSGGGATPISCRLPRSRSSCSRHHNGPRPCMHILRSTSSHRTRPQRRDPNSCAHPFHELLAGRESLSSTSRCGRLEGGEIGATPAHDQAARQVKAPDKSALFFRSRRSIRDLPENKVVSCPRIIRENRFRDDDADVELTITALPYEALEPGTGTLVTIEQKL